MNSKWPEGSAGELIEYLSPGALSRKTCPLWPPDAFAICASLLRRTGAYVRLVDPQEGGVLGDEWPERAGRIGQAWRDSVEKWLERNPGLLSMSEPSMIARQRRPDLPGELATWWSSLRGLAKEKLTDLAVRPELARGLCDALLPICVAADQASIGIGLKDSGQSDFLLFANARLSRNQGRSVCFSVPADKAVVLPKQRTPQRGLSLRSLTHHLALCPAGEVTATWGTDYYPGDKRDLMNLLLLPWPLELTARDFELEDSPAGLLRLAEPFRYFGFNRRDSETSFEVFLENAIQEAEKSVKRVHAIILPELALSWDEYCRAEEVAVKKGALLIAGINCRPGDATFAAAANVCAVQPAGISIAGGSGSAVTPGLLKEMRILQRKHHRWCLDRNQIIQYGLGGVMPASKACWELSEIERRVLHFFTLTDWLTVSVLICEDLARQEPAAEILRAIGPNLVIALLMDGPQLRTRWPAHYAGVLADDPGSSVLTLTSLGMSRLSRPRAGEPDRSRTIALWRDARSGDHEIELGATDNACVLSLVSHQQEEFTADGRSDGGYTYYPVFGGLHSFKVPVNGVAGIERSGSAGGAAGIAAVGPPAL
jgi:hypothetical protein